MHDSSVLLVQHPEEGDRFRGQWNGIGGHVEAGEDIRAAARRELREEAGLDVDALSLRGVVHETGMVGHAHVLFVFVGSAVDARVHSPEGRALRWQPLERLAELPLVHDVSVLLPRALDAEEPFFATERYDGGDRHTEFLIDGVALPSAPNVLGAGGNHGR